MSHQDLVTKIDSFCKESNSSTLKLTGGEITIIKELIEKELIENQDNDFVELLNILSQYIVTKDNKTNFDLYKSLNNEDSIKLKNICKLLLQKLKDANKIENTKKIENTTKIKSKYQNELRKPPVQSSKLPPSKLPRSPKVVPPTQIVSPNNIKPTTTVPYVKIKPPLPKYGGKKRKTNKKRKSNKKRKTNKKNIRIKKKYI